jgi:glycerol-3-phosphate dehydrogenase
MPPIAAPKSTPAPARWKSDSRRHLAGHGREQQMHPTTINARALVNAGGLGRAGAVVGPGSTRARVRLVQGSHIVAQLYEHDRAYMFQNADGRIISYSLSGHSR